MSEKFDRDAARQVLADNTGLYTAMEYVLDALEACVRPSGVVLTREEAVIAASWYGRKTHDSRDRELRMKLAAS